MHTYGGQDKETKAMQDSYNNKLPTDGTKSGGTSHYATFLLRSKTGTVYVFSKNGNGNDGKYTAGAASGVATPIFNYGPATGIGGGSPYYRKNK
jgi:hypothetical protein